MTIEEKLNSFTKFERTDIPFDYRYGLGDDNFDASAFCCEVERIHGYKAEDVYVVLKDSVLGGSFEGIDDSIAYPSSYVIDVQNAIIKLDDFIAIKKKYLHAS